MVEHFSPKEIPTSAKFNTLVDGINSATNNIDRFVFSDITVEDIINNTFNPAGYEKIHMALINGKLAFIKSQGSYIQLIPHSATGSYVKFAFIFGGAVYECTLSPSDQISYVKRDIAPKSELDSLSQKVGDLSKLETEDKTSLVNAINEAATKGGENSLIERIKTLELEIKTLRMELNSLKQIVPIADENNNGIPDGEERLKDIETNVDELKNRVGNYDEKSGTLTIA